ncbi:hypothetical protein [Halomonas ramblicola]|uniref:hypothetical protein n=1 Tax=Halomonas ramblicola TaxID=747349 RepID=UPI0025B2D6A9|nr:hypothetical protein [Halomonas ramblicola]MDN3522340.1 hypothetical protein [Halomonas ramblicola]
MSAIASRQPLRPARSASMRRPARWWLAGLLVGCLLPAGLAQGDALRQAERLVQVCILAPALIRASSRLQARRRASRRWPPRRSPHTRQRLSSRRPIAPCRRSAAAHDVLTRRGPPPAWAS